MKKLGIIALAAIMMGCSAKSDEKMQNSNKQQMVIENILTRVSVRQFTGETISNEQIQTLLHAAMAAPTAMNRQPWAFMVITDTTMLARLGEAFPFCHCGKGAACAFVMCGDMNKVIEACPDFWIHDVSAATENLLLAAHAMDLGAVWTGVFPNMDRVNEVRAMLAIPEQYVPLCIVPVGHPAEQPEIKDKFLEENIHYNVW